MRHGDQMDGNHSTSAREREDSVHPEGATTRKIILINAIVIPLAAAVAIVAHAVLPAPVDELMFDSSLVQLFGFPIVAVSYFLILFLHCAIVVQAFGRRAHLPRLETGFRFGVAFAILYLIGMQEIAVEASPFAAWGLEYVVYQFFMGVGDALPVLLLCTVLAYATLSRREGATSMNTSSAREQFAIVALIASTFFVQRTIAYTTGIVESDIGRYPVETLLWTALFGAGLGCAYVVLYPMFVRPHGPTMISVEVSVLTIGINWILFNSFIGLIFSGLMPQMLLRSGLDVAVLFLTSLAALAYFRRVPAYGRLRA